MTKAEAIAVTLRGALPATLDIDIDQFAQDLAKIEGCASPRMPRLFRSLLTVHGLAYGLWRDDDAVARWLSTPHKDFGGVSPLRWMLQGQTNIDQVVEWFRAVTDDEPRGEPEMSKDSAWFNSRNERLVWIEASDGQHTPGPWVAEGRKPNMIVVFAGETPGMRPSPCMLMDGNQEANARLIAAAPTMLEALKAMTEEWVDYMTINHLGDPWAKHNMKLARAAIAKATQPGDTRGDSAESSSDGSLIEAMARAMRAQKLGHDLLWDGLHQPQREIWLDLARAALAAQRTWKRSQ